MLKKITPVREAPPVDNATPGVSKKPDGCYARCPLAYKNNGIVMDWVPTSPKIAVMFGQPGKEDVTERLPASDGYGRYFWGAVAKPLGLTKNDILFTHAIRCYSREYPTGVDATKGEQACRQWDRFCGDPRGEPSPHNSLVTWEPNLFICTFALDKMVEIGAYYELALSDFKKALRFADAGYRPVVLMGTEALSLVAPWLSGGIKRWRGHWWEGEWKWKNTNLTNISTISSTPSTGFSQADLGYGRSRFQKRGPAKKQGKDAKQKTLFTI